MFILILFSICFSQSPNEIVLYGSAETLGYYYIELFIGTPPSRQTVIVDTGSSLTAFPCLGCTSCGEHIDSYYDYSYSSTFSKLSCDSGVSCSSCNNNVCEYHQSYAEGSSISGILAEDVMSFSPAHESDLPVRGVFGCHQKETNLLRSQRANGIMGLSRKKNKINSVVDAMFEASQIETNTLSLCLGMVGGIMTVGEYNVTETMKWTKMYDSFYYSVKLKSLSVDSHNINIQNDKSHPSVTIIDSGTTFSYLVSDSYNKFLAALKKYCKQNDTCKAEKVKVSGEPEECFVYNSSLDKKDFFNTFPVITIDLEDTQLTWLPENYLFAWPDEPDYYCIGIYSNFDGRNILGTTFMRGYQIIFDRSFGRIGFEKKTCGSAVLASDPVVGKNSSWLRNLPVFGVVVVSCSFMGLVNLMIWGIGIRNAKNEVLEQ